MSIAKNYSTELPIFITICRRMLDLTEAHERIRLTYSVIKEKQNHPHRVEVYTNVDGLYDFSFRLC